MADAKNGRRGGHWDGKLESFERESSVLKSRVKQLEEEITRMESALYREDISSYRANLTRDLGKTFLKTFKQRDELPAEESSSEEWDRLTRRLKTCIKALKKIASEDSGACSDARELKEFLKQELESEPEAACEEVISLIESAADGK